MSNDVQQHQHRCETTDCSPKSLARKIEGCIVRNAWDEEKRAQKALFLLKARDRRIAYLEQRVVKLENVAANLHEVSLRNSSRTCTLDKEGTSDFTRSENSMRTNEETDKSVDTTKDSFDRKRSVDCDTSSENRTSVPCLNLSKSSASISDKDIFSTPALDFVFERRKDFVPSACVSVKNHDSEKSIKQENKFIEECMNFRSESKLRTIDDDKDPVEGTKTFIESDLRTVNKAVSENDVSKKSVSVLMENSEIKDRRVPFTEQQKSTLPRTSSSVRWIRAKHSFRKKLQGFELEAEKRVEKLPAEGGQRTFRVLGPIETGYPTNQRRGKCQNVDDAEKTEKNTVTQDQGEALDAQETSLVAVQKIDTETQTSAIVSQQNEKILRINEVRTEVNHTHTSYAHLEPDTSSPVWNMDEDPAPQWLIEEALKRRSERTEQWTKDETVSKRETEYKTTICELKAEVIRIKADLEEALRTKSIVKEKYKRSLENVKAEARKESEMLQDRILRMAVTRSNKLKRELAMARKELKNKSEKCESISECFDRLKQEMETAEGNLNNLISENLALRKSIDDTREWMMNNMGKEQNEKNNVAHFRNVQKNKELSNMKKKAEEDLATITQLRKKLLRSESTNANKGFLLNSYKSQLADLNKEKNQLVSKIDSLQNDVSAVKNNNSQLKAKISVLNNEKDKLLSENEKFQTDVTEKMEIKCAKKYEETLQQKSDSIRAKYEETIKSMEVKLTSIETQNMEYAKAIKELLKRLHDYGGDSEAQKTANENEASEKEAHKTACNILNMTPEELSNFINGKSPNSINSWIIELNLITAKNKFCENLSTFLFKKIIKKMKA